MMLAVDWATWTAVLSALAAVCATLLAFRTVRDNRSLLAANSEMAAGGVHRLRRLPAGLPLPTVRGGLHPTNIHAGESVPIVLEGHCAKHAVPGLELCVLWRGNDGEATHEKRVRATAVRP